MTIEGIRYFLTKPGGWFFFLSNRGLLKWMPDEPYLKRVFRYSLGYTPDLEHPKTFNEKLNWLKLHDRQARYTRMVDKYEAKRFAAGVLGEAYIVPNYGVWERFDDIDFDALPEQFVLKCTHDSGGLVICRDKARFDRAAARKKLEGHLHNSFYAVGREWPYKDVKPRLLAEAYLDGGEKGLTDYKFFCLDGEPRFLYISRGLEHHPTAEISFYDLDGRELPFHRSDFRPYHNAVMPENFADMKAAAGRLAAAVGCPFVRIDLYSVGGRIYFSEITFSPCSGMIPFEPAEADAELGALLHLPTDGALPERKGGGV